MLSSGFHSFFCAAEVEAVEIKVNGWGEAEGEDQGAQNPADDGNGERLEHCGTGANPEGKREHSGNGREGGHGDRAQAAAASLDHGFFSGVTETAEAMFSVEKQNAVLGHNADDHDHAHAGSDVEGGVGYQESKKSAEAGEQRGGQDGSGRGASAKFRAQNGKQEQQRQE